MMILGFTPTEALMTPAAGQPFFLHLAAELARCLGDPDWQILVRGRDCYANGVPVGFRERLPRTPAVFERKIRWRRYEPEDYTLEEKANYSSAVAAKEAIRAQFVEEAKEGRMIKMPIQEARRKFGARLRIAQLAALEKNDPTFRVLHDGTNGAAANPNIRLRVQVRNPRGAELRFVLSRCFARAGATFGLAVDVSEAHRRFKHRPKDHGLLACMLDELEAWLNTVGTFGIGSASYWWSRLFSIIARTGISVAGQAELWQLLFADDVNLIAKGKEGK